MPLNITPQLFQHIAVGDRFGLRFGDFAGFNTFEHPCVVVAHDGDQVRLHAEPLNGDQRGATVAGKPYAAWIPNGTFPMGRSALNRRAEHHEDGATYQARQRQQAREAMLLDLLRETGHVHRHANGDDEMYGDVGALLSRLEALGLKLPEAGPGLTNALETSEATAGGRAPRPGHRGPR